jgi:hypothetical protein
MLHCVDLVRTDVSEEPSAYIIDGDRIGEQGTALAVTSYRHTLWSVRQLLVTANAVPSSPILFTVNDLGARFLRNVGSYKSRAA